MDGNPSDKSCELGTYWACNDKEVEDDDDNNGGNGNNRNKEEELDSCSLVLS